MTDDILIRQASAIDKDHLVHLRQLGVSDGKVWAIKMNNNPRYGYEDFILAEHQGQLVGCGCVFATQMWLSGVPLETGAVADVTIHPDYQNQGVFEPIMQTLLQKMVDQGVAISVLFPSAQAVYQAIGYAAAAVWHVYKLNRHLLPKYEEAKHVRVFQPDDLAAIRSVYRGSQLSRADGRLTRSTTLWDQIVAEKYRKGRHSIVVYDEGGSIDGYAKCRLIQDSALQIVEMFFSNDAAYRGLWGYFAARPDITHIHCLASADTPLLHTINAPAPKVETSSRPHSRGQASTFQDIFSATTSFMLRVVNVAEALTSRFYPHDMMGNRILKVNDPQLPPNSALVNFRIVDGRPDTLPVEAKQADLETDIATFSQIFCGFLKPETARLLGKLEANDETILWLSKAMQTNPLYIHQGDWF